MTHIWWISLPARYMKQVDAGLRLSLALQGPAVTGTVAVRGESA